MIKTPVKTKARLSNNHINPLDTKDPKDSNQLPSLKKPSVSTNLSSNLSKSNSPYIVNQGNSPFLSSQKQVPFPLFQSQTDNINSKSPLTTSNKFISSGSLTKDINKISPFQSPIITNQRSKVN